MVRYVKKVLIISEKYSPNLGDAVIFDQVYSILKDKFEIESLDLSGRKQIDSSEKFHNASNYKKSFKSIIKKVFKMFGIFVYGNTLKETIENFKKAFKTLVIEFEPDCILFAGGQLFMDSFLEQILYVVLYAEKKGIKVIFNACGCSNIDSLYEKKSLKRIVHSEATKYISMRDHYEVIKNYEGNIKKVYDTFDTALLSHKIYDVPLLKKKEFGVGIMLDRNISREVQRTFWRNVISFLESQKKDYEIFCNGSIEDYDFSLEILKSLEIDNERIAKQPTSSKELVECINRYEKTISMRLHSLIIAYSYDIPTIAISWNPKVDEFYRKIGKSECCLKLTDHFEDVKNAITRLDASFLNRNIKDEIEASIEKNISSILKIIED